MGVREVPMGLVEFRGIPMPPRDPVLWIDLTRDLRRRIATTKERDVYRITSETDSYGGSRDTIGIPRTSSRLPSNRIMPDAFIESARFDVSSLEVFGSRLGISRHRFASASALSSTRMPTSISK